MSVLFLGFQLQFPLNFCEGTPLQLANAWKGLHCTKKGHMYTYLHTVGPPMRHRFDSVKSIWQRLPIPIDSMC